MTNPKFYKFHLEDDDADIILAKTIYGEARGEDRKGRIAVGWSVLNRVLKAREKGGYWWGNDIKEVCLKRYQYSCWNKGDPNRVILDNLSESDPVYLACLRIARDIIKGNEKSPIKDATHYYAASMKTPPKWANTGELVARIGGHYFFRGIP